MKPNERIPLHDHADGNSGGKLGAGATVQVVTSGGSGGDVGTGGVTTSDPLAELNIEGGQSVISAHGSMGATETFDPTDGNVHTGTLDADCVYTLAAPSGSGACLLELRITGSGGPWTETWPGSVTWVGGSAPTPPTTGVTAIRLLETLDGGSNWTGVEVGSGGVALGATASDIPGPGVASSVGAGTTASPITHVHALTYHDEPLTDGASNFIFDGGDIVVVTGVPN